MVKTPGVLAISLPIRLVNRTITFRRSGKAYATSGSGSGCGMTVRVASSEGRILPGTMNKHRYVPAAAASTDGIVSEELVASGISMPSFCHWYSSGKV